MNQQIKNWLDSAIYDIETAESMYESGKYIYTIFMCHLALEKILKAKVQEITEKMPPRVHNLRYLLKLTQLTISDETFEFISKLSDVSIPTRYPEDFPKLTASYNKKSVKEYLKKQKKSLNG